MSSVGLSRRAFLSSAAAFAGLSAAPAWAQAGRLVVGTWGGDYAKLVSRHIGDGVAKANGLDIVYDEAAEPPRQTKMLAERQLPRGSTDVQALINVLNGGLVDQNALEKLDLAQLPNAAKLLPFLKDDIAQYIMPQVYSGLVILYNPKLVPAAPTSLADLWKPGFREKLGFIDIQYMFNLFAASLASTGKAYDLEAGKRALLDLKGKGVRVVPTNEAMAQALKAGDVGVTVMWKARAVQWQNAGIPVETVAPAEGVMLYVQGFGIPRNARNKPGAYKMLDAALSKQAQEAFAVDFGYNPTVSDAVVAPDLRARIGFSDEETKRLINPDPVFFKNNNTTFKDWWDRDFKG
ncbi:hypothetical protein ASE63_21900 [Bosea sp. Root381]|uniref:ABC transporter substrate-binding protein n=1 Tax=Bosea sp. Root381 TaxID=1736524 RepID=UPI0006F86F57|nr:extracellular solute-binding protein [Bosea sp. Root381]KRE07989.1 hypothetical protein ASE63_21900 [Bosea sp. Root381]